MGFYLLVVLFRNGKLKSPVHSCFVSDKKICTAAEKVCRNFQSYDWRFFYNCAYTKKIISSFIWTFQGWIDFPHSKRAGTSNRNGKNHLLHLNETINPTYKSKVCWLRDSFTKKSCCSFGFCPNYLPPSPQFGHLVPLIFNIKNVDLF